MNEIEKAINTMQDCKDAVTKGTAWSEKFYINVFLPETSIPDFKLAIQALREKAEQEKGCEYCKGDLEDIQNPCSRNMVRMICLWLMEKAN